jgi:hypothetical protein
MAFVCVYNVCVCVYIYVRATRIHSSLRHDVRCCIYLLHAFYISATLYLTLNVQVAKILSASLSF